MGFEPINRGSLFTKEDCCVCLTSKITIKTRHYLELTIYQLIYFHSGMKSGSRTHTQSLNFEFAVNVFFFFTLLLYQKFFKFSIIVVPEFGFEPKKFQGLSLTRLPIAPFRQTGAPNWI